MFLRIGIPVLIFFLQQQPRDHSQLHLATDREAVLKAAREIIKNDPNAALITVDAQGRPRARTVATLPPQQDMTIWIATRPGTRKVRQIRANPRVTLYFSEDEKSSYLSIMGRASLHDDLATKERHKHPEAAMKEFWPDYPSGYLLIKVEPEWMEVTGYGVEAHPDNWRPQAVRFKTGVN